MSTAQPTATPERVRQPERPVIHHVFMQADVDLSDALGIDVPTFCGLWHSPDVSQGGPLPEHRPDGGTARLCGNCTRTRRYRGRR